MSSFDDLTASIEKLGKQLFEQGRRTAGIAKLKIDLKSLDFKRRDLQAQLGEKFFRLHEQGNFEGQEIDENLMDLIEKLRKIEVEIKEILMELQEIILEVEDEVEGEEGEPTGNE